MDGIYYLWPNCSRCGRMCVCVCSACVSQYSYFQVREAGIGQQRTDKYSILPDKRGLGGLNAVIFLVAFASCRSMRINVVADGCCGRVFSYA